MKKERIFENLFEMAYEPYIVCQKTKGTVKNTFPTIFSAVNFTQEHSLIKINPGVYEERIIITKCDLKIQASELSENTILINRENPNIIVDVPDPNSKVILESLKIANVCEVSSRQGARKIDHPTLKKHNYMKFKTHLGMNTCLYIKQGTVQLDECKISLTAYDRKEMLVPAIVVEKNGCLILNRSEIKGGKGSIGILCKGGKVIIKQSIISDHGGIGLLASGGDSTMVSIKNSTFHGCNESIVLNGPFQALIENTIITESIRTGLVICNGNVAKFINNEIKNGEGNGMEIKNGAPSIMKNSICGNLGWGVKIISVSGVLCQATLKFNSISQNNKGGVKVEGSLNTSPIFNNEMRFNNRFGIRVENRSTPHIFMNKVMNTLGVGVYIMDNCSSFVEKNTIEASLKANLVIMGPNNIHNFIYENKILNARGEGIFMVYCEKFTLKQNLIQGNFNGIVSMTGVVNIEENIIRNNERNGILLIKDNNVKITNNELTNNKKAGLFIRDTSTGQITANHFKNNRSELVIENDSPNFEHIQATNKFSEGEIRIPSNYSCQLI